jgi:hypothetical protein
MIVDQHQPVVEKYYGPGKMKYVVERLLEECDRVVKGVIESWEEERSMKRKVSLYISVLLDVGLCIFELSDISNSTLPTSNRKPVPQVSVSEGEVVDPREIDKVLSELAGMAGRWSLFRKFLCGSLKVDTYLRPRIPSH